MGMYTEFVMGCSLNEDTPKEVIDTLKGIFRIEGHTHDGANPPTRGGMIPFGSSYYFVASNPHSKMERDSLNKTWLIYIRCNIKNYEHEIEHFINWIMPYVESGSGVNDLVGYTIYEESEVPRLYYKGDVADV